MPRRPRGDSHRERGFAVRIVQVEMSKDEYLHSAYTGFRSTLIDTDTRAYDWARTEGTMPQSGTGATGGGGGHRISNENAQLY